MTAAADNTGQTSRYTYNADGQRTRRQVTGSQEEWQIYGFDGELLAEYRASSPASSPEKEYGYRNGQLLVTATGRFNVALAANGAVATASSTATGSGFSTTGAINGNNRGPWGNGVEGWNDNTPNAVPDWIQVDFAGSKTIDEISVFGLHDNYTQENNPTLTQTFSLYGLIAFNVQYWNGSAWVTILGGTVTGNNKVWRNFTFSPITTNKIRVFINTVPDAWSRVVEIQAFGTSAGGEKVQWLVPDHLGTPRIIVDQTGNRANVKHHDYLPFGEELFAGTGGRTTSLGYLGGDAVRQQFTSKERDIETGLDYFLARYYSSVQGRFTSPDEFAGGPDELFNFANDAAENPTFYADLSDPQSLNKYQYTYNNPINLVDEDGHCPICLGAAAAALILTSSDTANAPRNPQDPRYRSGDSVKTMTAGAAAGVVLGPIAAKILGPITRAAFSRFAGKGAGETAATASRSAVNEAAVSAANEAQKLSRSVRPGAAGAAQATTGEIFTATSGSGALNPVVQKVLDKIPPALRSRTHGACCEPKLASKMVDAGVNPKGASYSVVRVRAPGNPNHGTAMQPCDTCKLLLNALNNPAIK